MSLNFSCHVRKEDSDAALANQNAKLESSPTTNPSLSSSRWSTPSTPLLSHCWGSSTFLTLTSTTLQLLTKAIPISELRQTFQDAIVATRLLGVEFIWIDSLCIIQDSRDDWRHETPLMQNVYRGALFDIAAIAAASAKASCFTQRNPSLIKPCVMQTA